MGVWIISFLIVIVLGVYFTILAILERFQRKYKICAESYIVGIYGNPAADESCCRIPRVRAPPVKEVVIQCVRSVFDVDVTIFFGTLPKYQCLFLDNFCKKKFFQ